MAGLTLLCSIDLHVHIRSQWEEGGPAPVTIRVVINWNMDAYYKHMFAGLVLVAAISWGASALLTSSDAREFLWPLPQDYLFSGTPVTVDSTDFQFIGEGAGGKSETLQAAFRRYKVYLFDQGESTMKGIIARLNVVVNSSSESLNQKINESCEFLE